MGLKANRLGEGGHSLVGVMAVTVSVLLVGVAIFTLGHAEGDLVEQAVDDARAFYVAEGGLERARGWLGDLLEDDPGANPVGMSFDDQTLGGGTYTVAVTDNLSGSWLPAYEVVCTGQVGNVTRCLRNVMIPETFAKYQWFRERGNTRWLRDWDRYTGPVHVNGNLRINGDPYFGHTVSIAGDIRTRSGSDPTFERGYTLGSDAIPLPTANELRSRIRTPAQTGGVYGGTLPGNASYYEVELGVPSAGEFRYRGWRRSHGSWVVIDGPHDVDIDAINGAVWFEEPITIEGTLDGQLTICSPSNIEIVDDLLYYDSSPGSGPNPGCDDVLGLISLREVIIGYTTPNMNDCEIHGVAMALNRDIEVEDYRYYAPRGDLVVYGGFIVDRIVRTGRYRADGTCRNGYNVFYNWDRRLLTTPPPHFPLTGNYVIDTWEEITPPEA